MEKNPTSTHLDSEYDNLTTTYTPTNNLPLYMFRALYPSIASPC
jgi:hypothetical protein